MIRDISQTNLDEIKNPQLRANAEIYVRIYQDFMDQIRQQGIEIEKQVHTSSLKSRLAGLKKNGINLRNNQHSVSINEVSTACKACRQGVGSATFFISLQCHRDCFYCFNPYQENYEYFSKHSRDVSRELDQMAANGMRVSHIALTGGEPLLHKEEAIQFFEKSQQEFPDAHTRLYTTGDQLDDELLQDLKEAGLQEIRFSIRMHDTDKAKELTFKNIALAREYIPEVMVEMPILPGTREEMKEILIRLDDLGVYGINLLEFCFPLHNAEEFRAQGYKVKARPYHVLYNYWYAGGLPVAGSEELCLDLVEFAQAKGLKMGVHYCSLENKHTGQIYQQNEGRPVPETAYHSPRDYFLKSAMVFGDDIAPAKEVFDARGYSDYRLDEERDMLEFHVKKIKLLKHLDLEVGISTAIHEIRDGDDVMRELKLDVTTPKQFKLSEV